MAHCLRSKNYVNLMVGSKQPQPVFLSIEEADKHCQAGASIWKFASTDEGLNPDVVLVGIGSELTFEVITAASLLWRKCPSLRVRVVNVTDLMILESATHHPHSLSEEEFSSLFTPDKPIIFNYHGYSNEIRGLLFGRPNLERVTIGCYKEEGSTTTPFDMMLCNGVSRYHVMDAAIRCGARSNDKVSLDMVALLAEVKHQVVKVQEYILATGKDPEGTFDIPMFPGTIFEEGKKVSAGNGSKEDGFFVN
jgi:xylulose-5-phosphate/fructose-6-phosphate phosphoketolase